MENPARLLFLTKEKRFNKRDNSKIKTIKLIYATAEATTVPRRIEPSIYNGAGCGCRGHCLFTNNSFSASGEFCCLLMIFSNSLDPDQSRQNVGPDLDPNYLTL